jgi:hypothetical protein
MKSLEYDLKYLLAGMEILEEYLISGEVFWPMNISPPKGEPEYPRMTLDGMLLAGARLIKRRASMDKQIQVEQALSELDIIRIKWRVAWEGKAEKCFHIRERMWRNFIQEYQDNPQENADRYPYEVRIRVKLELLKNEISRPSILNESLLGEMDGYLRNILVGEGFIWEVEVQAGFPESEYWFLYGKLPPLLF